MGVVAFVNDFVNIVIFFSSILYGVSLIIFRNALPTIVASAPALTYFWTSSGVETPNPTPIGILSLCVFAFLIAQSVYY